MRTESTSVYRQLDRLFRTGTVGGLTDPQLLEQFASGNEESSALAFEAIVKRHWPMVLRVCRTILQDVHAAEDAFQATFLVLARKARRLGASELLGNWLYGVAARTARKAKAIGARRRILDWRAASRLSVAVEESPHDQSQADLERVLHEEIDRLPHSYRAAIVVCYLEGLSQAQAAQELRVAESTVRGRLARARKLLGQRLVRRGVVPCMGLAALSSSADAPWRLPGALAQATAQAALFFVNRGKAMPSVVSATARSIANGVLFTMWFSPLKTIAVTLTALSFIAIGSSLLAQRPEVASIQGEASQSASDVENTTEPAASAPSQDERPKPAKEKRKTKGQRQAKSVSVDPALAKLASGPILRAVPISQDCTIIAYLPNQNLGYVDRITIQNGGGGVRALIDWPAVPPDEAGSADRRYLIALYSRKTTLSPPTGSVLAFELLEGWREMTWWSTQPKYDPEPIATYPFEQGDGWKLFDITSLVRAQAKANRSSHGILLRFLSEDAQGNALSTYEWVSREGAGEWANFHPVLLIVEASKPAEAHSR